MKMLRLSRKKVLIIIVLILASALVALFVGYRNREAINKLYNFQNASMYSNDVVLFYDNNCSHCAKVEDFIKGNNIEENINFVRMEILNNPESASILEDKVQICGLDFEHIGVPFLWDGKNKKCIIGYVDVINFFKGFVVRK